MSLLPNIRNTIKMYRSIMAPSQRKRTRQTPPRIHPYPLAIERSYYRFIQNALEETIEASIDAYMPFLMRYVPRKRTDAIENEMEEINRTIAAYFASVYGTGYTDGGSMGRALSAIAERLFGRNSTFFEREITIRVGVPLSIDTLWWSEVKSLWMQENYRQISSLSANYITELNTIILNGVRAGTDFPDLLRQIEKLGDKMKGFNSYRLARDQIGKLNGAIAKAQSLSIGAETYVWITARDERVRGDPLGKYPKAIPSHYAMESLLFSWNNLDVFSDDGGRTWKPKTGDMVRNHPGMEIMCRCVAASTYIDLYEIDRELGDVL